MADRFIVVEWRGDGRYHAKDAIGSRIYKREHAAQEVAEELNRVAPVYKSDGSENRGWVVRNCFFTDGLTITAGGHVSLSEVES